MTTEISRRDFLKAGLAGFPLMALQMSPAGRTLQGLSKAANEGKPNILILVFDTLSASHMSLHGYGRETTPNLIRFAENATVYHNHYAGGNFTSPGTASLLTGTYPWTHRAIHLYGTVAEDRASHNLFAAFNDSYYKIAYTHNPVVASLLQQFRNYINQWKPTRELCLSDRLISERLFPNDYNAAYASEWEILRNTVPGSLSLSFIDRISRYSTRLDLESEYGTQFPRGIPNILSSLSFVLEDVFDWLLADLQNLPQPFLAYIHVLPPHEPYTTREEFVDMYMGDGLQVEEKPAYFVNDGHDQFFLDHQRRLYDEYLAYTDAEFGRFYDKMLQENLLDNTLMVVTSDHGQSFERGIHGHATPALYQPLIKVPLLIRRPNQIHNIKINAVTSCVDILPTLLTESGQAIPSWVEGNLLPNSDENIETDSRAVFALEAKSNPKFEPLDLATIAMIKEGFKLVQNRGYGRRSASYELYDLASDPEEIVDLATVHKEMGRTMSEELALILPPEDDLQ